MSAEEPPAEEAAAADEGTKEPELEVPEQLNLLHFLGKEELCDCSVQLPPAPAAAEAEGADGAEAEAKNALRCHRVVLCSGSGYFFRSFHAPPGSEAPAGTEVELPPLPDDPEVRRQVDVRAVFPLALRYMYGGQQWEVIEPEVTPENAMGLFAMASLLEIRPLARRAFECLDSTVLGPSTAAQLLYAAVRLRAQAKNKEIFQEACDRCSEVLRQEFSAACKDAESVRLLCRLPCEVLTSLLTADDLQVASEAEVLLVARRLLAARMRRKEVTLHLSEAKLAQAPELLKQLKKAEGGVVWELLVLEEPPAQGGAQEPPAGPPPDAWLAPAASSRYAAATAATSYQEAAGDECEIAAELALRAPASAVRRARQVVLRAKEAGEGGVGGRVLLAAALPTEALPAPGGEEAAAAEAGVRSACGSHGGLAQFKWRLAEAEAPAEGEGVAEAEEVLSDAETAATLEAVRFPQLEHKELLTSAQDPVLLEAGAQPVVLEALSSRLEAYEQGAGAGRSQKGPRPSTLQKGAGGGGATQALPPPAPVPAPRPGTAPALPPGAGATQPASPELPFARGAGALPFGASRGLGGVAGHPLFPCGSCGGQGQLLLKQLDMQWVAQCNRMACRNTVRLPACVMAAAVDGHCATCTVKFSCDVRTLTVRVGRQHASALQRLPGGVDTLRGVCIAGCNETLGMLEN